MTCIKHDKDNDKKYRCSDIICDHHSRRRSTCIKENNEGRWVLKALNGSGIPL